MSQFQSAPPVTRSTQLVAAETPCVVCGYSLRGLPEIGLCPECGTPVERSLLGGHLCFSSPAHIASLHRGALLAELATIAIVPVCILILAMGLKIGGLPPGGALLFSRPLAPLFWHASTAALSVLMLIGWWMVSRPDPAAAATARPDRAAPLLRAALLIQSIAMIAGAIAALGPPVPVGALSASQFSTLLIAVGLLAWVGGLLASAAVVRRLSRRIPDLHLHRQAHTLQLFTTVVLGVLAGVTVLVGTLAGVNYGLRGAAIGIVTISACLVVPAAALALLTSLVLNIILLDRLRSVLRVQRNLSQDPTRSLPVSTP